LEAYKTLEYIISKWV